MTDTEVSYQEIIKPEPREDASSEDDDIESDNTESES